MTQKKPHALSKSAAGKLGATARNKVLTPAQRSRIAALAGSAKGCKCGICRKCETNKYLREWRKRRG